MISKESIKSLNTSKSIEILYEGEIYWFVLYTDENQKHWVLKCKIAKAKSGKVLGNGYIPLFVYGVKRYVKLSEGVCIANACMPYIPQMHHRRAEKLGLTKEVGLK